MGFLDKLLGRKKSDAGDEGMRSAPQPSTMPPGGTEEHSHGEGEHSHEGDEEQGPPAGGPA
jgi:hypothetical protein